MSTARSANESNDGIERNNATFARRVRAFHRSEEGRAIRQQLLAIEKQLYRAYRQIALEHWKENGNNASTGWGHQPEGRYQTPLKRERCAATLAEKLTEYMMENPKYALGAK